MNLIDINQNDMIEQLCYFSCLNYQNPERKVKIMELCTGLKINMNFHPGTFHQDPRISSTLLESERKVWSCMYGHLDMIQYFYDCTDSIYGIFCEDDILISPSLKKILPEILNDLKTMNLDVLLLGYLINHPPTTDLYQPLLRNEKIQRDYYSYPDHLWGAQMYLITRTYAEHILNQYNQNYAIRSLQRNLSYNQSLLPFSADWIITKDGNRCLIYPMLVCENGENISGDKAHDTFHISCYEFSHMKINA